MAKEKHDRGTMELPGFDKPPGRPRLVRVKPGSVRTAEWRERREKQMHDLAVRYTHVGDIELARYMAWADNFSEEDRVSMWREYGRRHGWR
jgi:hypothetical protein